MNCSETSWEFHDSQSETNKNWREEIRKSSQKREEGEGNKREEEEKDTIEWMNTANERFWLMENKELEHLCTYEGNIFNEYSKKDFSSRFNQTKLWVHWGWNSLK